MIKIVQIEGLISIMQLMRSYAAQTLQFLTSRDNSSLILHIYEMISEYQHSHSNRKEELSPLQPWPNFLIQPKKASGSGPFSFFR